MQDQLDAAERRLRETAEAIVRALAEHVSAYPTAELRRRFVQRDALDALSDAELAAAKADAVQVGRAAAARVERDLAWPGPWLLSVAQLPTPGAPATKATLRDFPLLWAAIAPVDGEVEALASRHGFGADDRDPPGYPLPAMFIGGIYLKAETERLVKCFAEIADLRGQVDARDAEGRRRDRERRWAAANSAS